MPLKDLFSYFTLHKKWSFPLRISPVNVTKSSVSWKCSDEDPSEDAQKNIFNPLLRNVVKWSDTLLKSFSKCKVCLTILLHCEVKSWSLKLYSRKKNPLLCVDNNLQKCFQTDTLENTTAQIFLIVHCVKGIQIQSYFWSVFSCIWTKYGDLRSKSLYSVRMQEITDQK